MAMLLFRKKKEIVKRLFNQNRAAAAAYSFMWKKKIRVPERLYWKRAALNRIEKLYKPEKGESKKVIRYSFFAFTSNDRGARKWLARREKKKRKAMRGLFKIKMAYEGRGINYLKKRDARQWNEGVLKGAEGKPFWTVDWWKKPTIKTFQEWNYEKWGFVKEPYKVYVEKNGGFKKTPVKWEKIIPNVGGRFIKYFLKRFFKVFFKKIMKKIKTAGPRVLNNTTYGKLKESVTFYFYLLKGLIVKSNFRPASYFLSNVTFKKIWNPNFVPDYYSRSFLETSSLPRGMPNPVGAFSVAGVKDFSNYIAYNKFVLLKFLLYMLGFTKSVFNLNFNNIKFFTPIAGFAKKKYRDMVKKKKKERAI